MVSKSPAYLVGRLDVPDSGCPAASKEIPSMGELIQSLFRFSLDVSLFALRQMADLIGSGAKQDSNNAGSDRISNSTPGSNSAASPKIRLPAKSGRLGTGNFMVLGEGLSAGMGDFYLNEVFQRKSFPAQM